MLRSKNLPKSFIFFLILATLIWLIINLSKVYYTVVPFYTNYTKLPQDKILLTKPLQQLDVRVHGTGFKLFWSSFSQKTIAIPINSLSHKKANVFYILPNGYKKIIQSQLPDGIFFNKILEDTLFFDLGQLVTKKVVVKPNLSVQYKLGYDLADKITVFPDSVRISGTKKQLKKINEVFLEQLDLQEVSQDIQKTLAIIPPQKKSKIKLETKKAELFVKVDKFTEGEFSIPIWVKNFPSSKKITIYPKTVKVLFKVGLKDFNKITPDVFEANTDYKYAKQNDLNFMLIDLKVKSSLVSSVRVVPEKIDFLIHK